MSLAKTVLVQLSSLALGGTQINAVDFAMAVEDYGYRSVLFGPVDTLPPGGPSLLDVASARGVKIETYQRARGVLIKGAEELEQRARSIAADIIHVYGADAEPRTAFWGPCRWGRRPFIHTVYEMFVEPDTYQHTSLIIGTGYLQEELRNRPGPTTLISPPVDVASDAPNGDLAEQFRSGLNHLGKHLIVIVSRLDKWMKAYPVETAIRAMTYLADYDATLVVVGTGTEEARLIELGRRVNRSAAKTLVHFHGAMADPGPAYAGADILLGMGGSGARSLAFGRPLVVQGEWGTSELFCPESSKSLFRRSFWSAEPQLDAPENLADLLKDLIDSPEQREELGRFGREFAVKSFNLDAMSRQLASVYEQSFKRYGRLAWLRDVHREVPELADSMRRRMDPARYRRCPAGEA